jgi:hypothetical protein
MIKRTLVTITVLFLLGCPTEDNEAYCSKVMVCQDDREMLCAKNDSGCGEDCHYFVTESCWEECKEEEGE